MNQVCVCFRILHSIKEDAQMCCSPSSQLVHQFCDQILVLSGTVLGCHQRQKKVAKLWTYSVRSAWANISRFFYAFLYFLGQRLQVYSFDLGFLAVHNSSIGDLVTDSVTNSLTNFYFWHYRVTLETFDLWDIWSETFGRFVEDF